MSDKTETPIQVALTARYADPPNVESTEIDTGPIATMLTRGSCRSFLPAPVPDDLIDIACAAALAAPTKSDLQQRDIILLRAADKRQRLADLVSGQAWVAEAPMIAVFCGNNRRQRLLHEWHGVPFANDHLDAFFNAAADAAIALGAFVTAAEALGLGCCPISAVRNKAAEVSDLLRLPDHVFPFAGLAVGVPDGPVPISKRLPLSATCHTDAYCEDGLRQTVERYDQDRAETQPYATQRLTDVFGQSDSYGWSDDKVRQYSQPERADFGAFVRVKRFDLS